MSATEKTKNLKVVNQRVLKLDALGMACGTAEYTDDFSLPGMLVGKLLYCPHAHARIKKIDASEARKVPGVKAVLTHKDLPRIRHTTAGQGYPEPSPYDTLLLDDKMRFAGDRVAAVAAETAEAAEEALRKIKVEYEILPPVLSIDDAIKPDAPIIHDETDSTNIPDAAHNIAASFDFEAKEGEWFADADVVIEKTYRTQYAQHCALEPHTAITYYDANGRLVIRTSTQVPFHARRIVSKVLQIPVKNIRVIKPRIGGGFGSKQEILLDGICGALTVATKRPVKIEYSRREVFISSRTRHPSLIKLKTGVKKDGTITDAQFEIYINTGAYGAHGLTVMMCSGSHTIPMYQAKNNSFKGRAVYTNMPVAGAYRGFGATQGFFAWESQMDMMADAIGMDRIEFRKKNYIRQGEGSPVFKAMGEGGEGIEQVMTSCDMDACIDKAVEAFDWYGRKERLKGQTGKVRRGIGCVGLMQGSGIPHVDMAAATIKLNDDGSFNLTAGATDLGTGSDTVLAQIAAEVLGVNADDFNVYSSDTDLTPFDVGAYASSTTFISGNAARKAAEKVRGMIKEVAAQILGEKTEDLRLEGGKVLAASGASCTLAQVAQHSLYFKDQHQITASASNIGYTSPPPFAAHLTEVEVDTETGKVKVLDYVSTIDCGTPINPTLAEGQNDGAVMNGLSFAMFEELEFNTLGQVKNPSFRSYRIYTAHDAPRIQTIMVPTYDPEGPFGAKSVSEIGINGAQAAIANAIFDATGVRLYEPPFTPEKVLEAIKKSGLKF